MPELQTLFDRLEASRSGRPLPPVDQWHPTREGDSHLSIDVDGRWYYHGSPIDRPEMVRLFSTVMRHDPDGFVLVTPAERLTLHVADAPFIAVDFDTRGRGRTQTVAFETNVGDVVVADAQHPLTMRGNVDSPRPYLLVRGGLEARLSRPVYYRLVDIAVSRRSRHSVIGVWSSDTFFVLGRVG